MKIYFLHLILLFAILIKSSNSNKLNIPDNQSYSVLILTETAGWKHRSISIATQQFHRLSINRNWSLTHTNNIDQYFQSITSIQTFDVIVFLLTSGPIFNELHQKVFKQYVDQGGAVVGVHSATDTNKNWKWFLDLLGAEFVAHPRIQTGTVITEDKNHPTTSFLPNKWSLEDEFYNFVKPLNLNDKHILLRIDESSYKGGHHGNMHPISWTKIHQPVGSRIWYTALGHTDEMYKGNQIWSKWFQRHLMSGVEWAASGTAQARMKWQKLQADLL